MFGSWSSLPIPDGDPVSQIYKYKGPLTFPAYSPASPPPPDPAFTVPPDEQSFYKYFAKVRRATDVTREHLDVLNVSVAYDVPVQDMFGSSGASGAQWLPSDGDGGDGVRDETWAERRRELLIDNDVASEVMGRLRRDVKLGHMYKFFQSLEMVLPYYGTPAECAAYAAEQLAEQQQQQQQQNDQHEHHEQHTPQHADSSAMDIDSPDSHNEHGKRPAAAEIPHLAKKDRASPESDPAASADRRDDRFSMPERFRDDMIKNFIEPICWGHGVRVYPPRPAPKLHLQRSKFSIHLNYHVHLTPMDPAEARAGLVDGPVLGIQIRHEHAFRALADPQTALKKRRKKLMAAALAAKLPPTADEEAARTRRADKERARADRHAARRPRIPKPGAPPSSSSSSSLSSRSQSSQDEPDEKPIEGEMKEELDDNDGLGNNNEGILVMAPDGSAHDVVGVTREIAALLSMAQLRAKHGITERKIRFRAVGREDGVEGGTSNEEVEAEGGFWDDIFIVTCLHHHVGISHLRVSRPYLRFLRTGELPPTLPAGAGGACSGADGGWEQLRLQKTPHWSLLDPAERVEGARALVAVLKWLTRNEGKRFG